MAIQDYFVEPTGPVLSEEEVHLALEEARDLDHEVQYGFEEITRLEDMEDGLEQLRIATESIEVATTKDLHLVESSARLALAGSGMRSDILFPGLESFEGTTISTEGLKDIIKDIWNAIVRTIKKIWNAILAFFGKINDVVGRLEKMNDNMRERMEKVADKKIKNKSTDLANEVSGLVVDYKQPRNGQDVINCLNTLSTQGNVVFNEYTTMLSKTGTALAKSLTGFNIEKPEESLKLVTDAANTFDFNKFKRMLGSKTVQVDDKRWKDSEVIRGEDLPGDNAMFYIRSRAETKEADNIIAISEAARKTRVEFNRKKSDSKKLPDSGKVATISVDEALAIHQSNKQLLAMVKSYNDRKKEITRSKESLDKAADSLTKKVSKKGEVSATVRTFYKEAVGFDVAFAVWAAHPQMEMAKQILTTVRSSIVACNKSAANYE